MGTINVLLGNLPFWEPYQVSFMGSISRRGAVYLRPTSARTSYTEYKVDALAHETEEGRGDRRNVQGELHTSDEP